MTGEPQQRQLQLNSAQTIAAAPRHAVTPTTTAPARSGTPWPLHPITPHQQASTTPAARNTRRLQHSSTAQRSTAVRLNESCSAFKSFQDHNTSQQLQPPRLEHSAPLQLQPQQIERTQMNQHQLQPANHRHGERSPIENETDTNRHELSSKSPGGEGVSTSTPRTVG